MRIKLRKHIEASESINEALQILPSGQLVKRGAFYCHAINDKEIVITETEELFFLLQRKEYLQVIKKQLDNEILTMSSVIDQLDHTTPREIIRSMPDDYQDLPISHFFHPLVEDWSTKSYQKNPDSLEDLNYTSNNGTSLRSEPDLLIANKLEDNDIPYRYNAELTLGEQKFYPTFTVINPFMGNIIIWEHFDGLNQPGYEQKMNEKMKLYEKHGYIPYTTLIYTFEDEVKDTNYLQDLIDDIIFN